MKVYVILVIGDCYLLSYDIYVNKQHAQDKFEELKEFWKTEIIRGTVAVLQKEDYIYNNY